MSLKSGQCKQNSVNLLCIRGWKENLSNPGETQSKLSTWLHMIRGKEDFFFPFGWADLVRPQYKWGPRWLNEAATWSKNMQAPGPWQKATPLKPILLFARVWWVRVSLLTAEQTVCFFGVQLLINQQYRIYLFFHAKSEHSPHCAAGNKEWSYLVYTEMPASDMEICWQK